MKQRRLNKKHLATPARSSQLQLWRMFDGRRLKIIALTLLIALSSGSGVTAQQASSANYGVDETFFGTGGLRCEPGVNGSANYCASLTAGDLTVGRSSSASYQTQAGSLITDREPYIEMIVSNPAVDIGTLTTTSTRVATATFSVKAYLAGGYTVINASPGPQNGSYTMQGLSSQTGSSIGNEQFGINLKANTCPGTAPSSGPGSCSGTLGANPSQAPDSTFAFGYAATGYDTANQYKYVNGDTIAKSDSSSSYTDYTISYLYNISNVTPGGTYVLQHNLVATGTY